MFKTQIGLNDNARQISINVLQSTLNDALDLRLAIKHAHWTVRGPFFQQLHQLFDSLVAPVDAEIDMIAERIATLGGRVDGRSEGVAANTRLEPYPDQISDGPDHLSALSARFASLGNSVRKGIEETDEAGDAATADILTATAILLDKSLWMLEAHLG